MRTLFAKLIRSIDTDNKISVIEEDFHLASLNPMENEVRQRNIMAGHMKPGGWHIQIDSDEYFVNFNAFTGYLKSLRVNDRRAINVCCSLITLFKQLPEGFLYVAPEKKSNLEFIQIATRHPVYMYGRRNGHFNIYTNFQIVHQSWARSEAEILQKLGNWGHRDDVDANRFFEFWQALDADNYAGVRDFHPTHPGTWRKLVLVKAKDVSELMARIGTVSYLVLSQVDLLLKNSRVMAKLRQIFDSFKSR